MTTYLKNYETNTPLRAKGYGKSHKLKRPYVFFHAVKTVGIYSANWTYRPPFVCQENIDRIKARADELSIDVTEIIQDKVFVKNRDDAFLLYLALA